MSLLSRLHDAVKDGDDDSVLRLVEQGADINATYIRETAFTQALEAGRVATASQLMKCSSFNPNAGNKFERSPLFCAAKDDQFEIAAALLDKGAAVNQRDIKGVTPLGATAWYDSHRVAQLLTERGADVNQQDTSGESPLFRACTNVSYNVAKLLLANGADVSLRTFDCNSYPKWTPLMAALPSKYQLEVRKRRISEMIDIMNLILSHGPDVNVTQNQGMTALHLAVDRNELYGACLLAEHGCNLEVKDYNGLTPLQLAVQPARPRYEVALYLLLYGADVNSTFKDTNSGKEMLPLTMVMKTRPESELLQRQRMRLLHALIPATNMCGRNVFNVIETMLENTPVPIEDFNILQEFEVNQPCSLLGLSRQRIRRQLGQQIMGKIDTLPVGWPFKEYLSFDYNYKQCHPLNACRMHVSVLDKRIDELRDLLRAGCSVNVPFNSMTPLTLAAGIGNTKAVSVLLQCNANPEHMDGDGATALHKAAASGSDSVLKLLFPTNCDINTLDAEGNTPLQVAARTGHFETVILLLDNGADPSLVSPAGLPVLHLAAGSGHLRAVERILKTSQEANLQDRFGNTPLHVAASRGLLYLNNNIRLPFLYKNEVLEMMDACNLSVSTDLPQYVRQDGVHHLGVIQRLLEKAAKPDIENSEQTLPVDLARRYFKEATELLTA